jgi:hypothetical protein
MSVKACMQQPTAAIQPTTGDRTPDRRATPGLQGDRREYRGEQDDRAAGEVVAAEVRRRGGAADHPGLAAERVVEAVRRVARSPGGQRERHPPRRAGGRP